MSVYPRLSFSRVIYSKKRVILLCILLNNWESEILTSLLQITQRSTDDRPRSLYCLPLLKIKAKRFRIGQLVLTTTTTKILVLKIGVDSLYFCVLQRSTSVLLKDWAICWYHYIKAVEFLKCTVSSYFPPSFQSVFSLFPLLSAMKGRWQQKIWMQPPNRSIILSAGSSLWPSSKTHCQEILLTCIFIAANL